MAEHISGLHCFQKNGIWYFARRVPNDLRNHYVSNRISYSLRTRSRPVAVSRASRAAQQLDEYWYHLRPQNADLPGKHLLRMANAVPTLARVTPAASDDHLKLSEAAAIYLRLKGQGRPITFQRAAERACGYVIDACGDRFLSDYTRKDATAFRDSLLGKGLAGSSITRIFGTLRAVISFAASEAGIELNNPFAGVYYDRQAGVEGRSPIPIDIIRSVQAECRRLDDDVRWLVALVSDTGMRLAEAAGALKADFQLDGPHPHVVIQEHPWRRLKTSGSARLVPLVGASLWAGQRIVAYKDGSEFAFPRYNRTATTSANSASAALNKWLKPRVPERCTMHSFRHSMRDRLRAAECPADIVDQIGGWQSDGVGQSYGCGYPIAILKKWLELTAKQE